MTTRVISHANARRSGRRGAENFVPATRDKRRATEDAQYMLQLHGNGYEMWQRWVGVGTGAFGNTARVPRGLMD